MRTSWIVAALVSLGSHQLCAQIDSTDSSKKRIRYFNNFLAGGLLGKSGQGSGLALSTTHGIRTRNLSVGAGVGFDSYLDWKTLPVFGSLNFDFAKIKRNALFVQLNAGYSNAWNIGKEVWEPDYNVSGGQMINSMIGYRIAAKQYSIYICAGHKFQRINYHYNPAPWSSGLESKVSIEENMNRFVMQIGFGFH